MNTLTALTRLPFVIFVFGLLVTVDSCTVTQEPLVAEGLVTGEPCAPPCWQGLVPGSSTEDDVRRFLSGSEYVAGLYAVHSGAHEGLIVLRWDRRGTSGQESAFHIQDGVLSLMSMYVESDVTLEQVVGRFGTPDEFAAGLKMSGRIYALVTLFYREPGMILELHLYDDVPELKPETKVVRVWYFEPVPLEEAIAVQQGKKGEPLEDFELEWLGYWHDWQGYGVVEPDHSFP